MGRSAGDQAFEEAFDDLLNRAVRAARKILGDIAAAEDVAAEAMARAYAQWPKIADLDYRGAWVARVAANLAIDVTRRRPAWLSAPAARSTEDASVERLAVLAAVRRLPRRQREVITLSYLTDTAEADVARVLGISVGTVKQHLHRGLISLRKTLGAESEEFRLAPVD